MKKIIVLFEKQNVIIRSFLIVLMIVGCFLIILYSFKFLLSQSYPVYFTKIFFAGLWWLFVFNIFLLKNNQQIFLGVLFASLLSVWWFFHPDWLINNIIALSIIASILIGLPYIRLKLMIIICVGFFIYDLVAVYYLSIMVDVAHLALKNNLPLLIIVPKSLLINEESRFMAIGIGDVVIPILLIRAEIHRARKYSMPKVFNIPMMPLVLSAGYIIGLVFAILIFLYFNKSQPALVYIIPSMLLALLITYFKIGYIKIEFKR